MSLSAVAHKTKLVKLPPLNPHRQVKKGQKLRPLDASKSLLIQSMPLQHRPTDPLSELCLQLSDKTLNPSSFIKVSESEDIQKAILKNQADRPLIRNFFHFLKTLSQKKKRFFANACSQSV